MSTNIRQFRSRVARLKRQGLITGVDARSATPTTKSGRFKLSTLVNRYDDILSGKATAVKLTPKQLQAWKKAGNEVANGKAIVPHAATERVYLEKGEVVIKSTNGMERVILPIAFQNLGRYLRDIKKDYKRINRLKKANEYFGIRFHGNQSANFYSDIRFLIASLETYSTVIDARSKIKQQEVYKHLEILRMSRRRATQFEAEHIITRRKNKATSQAKAQKKYREKLKHAPKHIQKQLANKAAERMREYRKRMKKDKKKVTKYKKAARKRAKKSWNKRK